jgi:ferredoxin
MRALSRQVSFFINNSSQAWRVTVSPGGTLLDVLLRESSNGEALVGLCGGELQCTTCRVCLQGWQAAGVAPPREDELDVLDSLSTSTPQDRMACQVKVTAALEGLTVTIGEDIELP